MKILTIFIDMLRANRLSTFSHIKKLDTEIDLQLQKLGGTAYPNFFTPGPDTPRSMATYFTGVPPYHNGCTTRLKWPKHFLNKQLKTIFDVFIEKNYAIDCFASLNERANGLYPSHISRMDIHNTDNNIQKYLSQIELQDDHFLFISLPDYHWALDDFGYNTYGERRAQKILQSAFKRIFQKFHKDDFDHIFIFSDHGFKFDIEKRYSDEKMLVNTDRINPILFWRAKYQDNLIKDARLCSIADLMPTYEQIVNKTASHAHSLLSKPSKTFIVVEDHINFAPSINQNIELWAVVYQNEIYIRTLTSAITIDRDHNIISDRINADSDLILSEHSTFSVYRDEYEKVFMYCENILARTTYMNGETRFAKNKLYKYFYRNIDLINLLLKR